MSCETRRTKFPLSLSLAALFVVLAFGGGQLALAHTDPPGSDSTGITISLTAYWDADSSGTCSAGDATVISRGSFEVQPGELICYRSTLSWGGGTNAAFEGGTWTITLPSGGVVNVVPVTPIPCIGGTFNDPTPPVPGVGQCLGSPSFIISNFAPYTVNAAHESGAPLRLRAQTDYANGRAHLSAGDLTPVSASTPFALDAVTCNATLLKQVDCGDGAGWQDACSTVNGNPVQARYTITNTGELPLACTLGDDNPFFVPSSTNFPVPIGPAVLQTASSICSDEFEVEEPDTATLNCTCAGPVGPIPVGPLTDSADIDCLSCLVKVDKQVSCTDAAGYLDQGLVFNNEDLTNAPCVGTNLFNGTAASAILARYYAQNAGETGLSNCQLADSNIGITPSPIGVGGLAVGADPTLIPDPSAQLCSDALDALEPDTAGIVCDCVGSRTGLQASALDEADFECESPGLRVTKLCDQQVEGTPSTNAVHITVQNTGALVLNNCVITDSINLTDPTCPATPGTPLVTVPAGIASLAVGSPAVDVTASAEGLTSSACNTVSVTCDIAGTGRQITVTADDVCEAGTGCLTRTPGFWGTHPHVTLQFLPVLSCGLTVDGVEAEVPVSAIEDMCIDGGEAKTNNVKATSMQQLQLIRQCTAAMLNISATTAGDGFCGEGILETIDRCCDATSICSSGLSGPAISNSGCIELIDAFNNSEDTLDAFGPFISPGPANPDVCQESHSDNWVNPGRTLGPAQGGGKK